MIICFHGKREWDNSSVGQLKIPKQNHHPHYRDSHLDHWNDNLIIKMKTSTCRVNNGCK